MPRQTRIALVILGCTILFACSGTPAPDAGGCVKETDQSYCQRLGKTCEVLTGFDNCGAGRSVNCGSCSAPQTCGGGGVPNVCGAVAQGDAGDDGGLPDAGAPDSGTPDSGTPDAGCAIACPTAPHYFKGTFTITTNETVVNGTPYTHAFDGVVNVPVSFVASFDVTAQNRQPGGGLMNDRLTLTATGVDLFFSGDSSGVMTAVKNGLQNRTPTFSLESRNHSPSSSNWSVIGASGVAHYTVEISFVPSSLTYGADNVPNLAPFTTSSATVMLRRFAADSTFTDYAQGSAVVRFDTP